MTQNDCLIIEEAGQWQIHLGDQHTSLAMPASATEIAATVRQAVAAGNVKRPGCLLAPASTSCYFARLQVDRPADLKDRAAMTFQLEDHLPLDAESMAADFVCVDPDPSGPGDVAAVAIEVEPWIGIIDALEAEGVMVRSVVPHALLIARSLSESSPARGDVDLLLVQETHCDVIGLTDGCVAVWKHLGGDIEALRRYQTLSARQPERVLAIGASQPQQDAIESLIPGVEFVSESLDSHAQAGAALSLAKRSPRWFELRRDRLGPSDPWRSVQSQLRLLGIAAATCLLALTVGGWWRTQRVNHELANVRQSQEELFRQAFPEARIPGALLRRVRSEHARLMGSRGASATVDIPQSACDVLRELLRALPNEVRFRITRIEILDGRVDLEIQVRSPVDAGALAASLSNAGFRVKPPVTTQRDERTFDSALEAVWQGAIRTSLQNDNPVGRVRLVSGATR